MHITFPHLPGSGGPGSFQTRFEAELKNREWHLEHGQCIAGNLPDVIFVVGGTRKLPWLAKMRRRGVPIVYRLDGLLWLHRLKGFGSTPSKWLGAEIRNTMAQKFILAWLILLFIKVSLFGNGGRSKDGNRRKFHTLFTMAST